MIYRFAEFEVDDREFRLSSGGAPVQVEPKVLRLLICLIENRNRLVRKQELLDKVWPDAAVTENALTRTIGLLRKGLNDDSHVPRFIETVPTAGYRFIATVTVVEENPGVEPAGTGEPASRGATSAERFRRSRMWIVAGAIALAAIGAGVLLFVRHHTPVSSRNAAFVLADFDNRTGDPVFDGTLRQALAMQFEQPPFVTLTDERIQEVLRMMRRPADSRLTPAIAREICVRTSSAVVLDSSITSLGSQYVLGLRATDCPSGRVIGEEQVQAARKEDVLRSLDDMARRLSARISKWLTTAGEYETPIWEATTPSVEALKLYSLGQKKLYTGDAAALLYFRRAIQLDPNFAMVYLAISLVYSNRREPEHASEAIRMAYGLQDSVNERDRLIIEVNYNVLATGELEKAEQPLKALTEAYPKAPQPHNNLGNIYRRLGDHEKAMEQAKQAQQLQPTDPLHYQNLGADYVSLNRFHEADAVYKLAEERGVVSEGSVLARYLLAFLKGEEAQMAKLASLTPGKPGEEDAMLAAQAETAAWHGKLNEARELTGQAVESAHRNDVQETAGAYQAELALFEAELGNQKRGRANAYESMKLSPTRYVQALAALALARSGDGVAAERIATNLSKAFPVDTLVQRYWLPAINAAVALERKDPRRAVQLLQAMNALELSQPGMFPVYLRGQAYLMSGDGRRAVAEFQKFIDHRGLVRNSSYGALARLGLARAYAMEEEKVNARMAYQEFLALFKDADPDIAILNKARLESAALLDP